MKDIKPNKLPCNINPVSSRCCELGTKSCTVEHKKKVTVHPIEKFAAEMWKNP